MQPRFPQPSNVKSTTAVTLENMQSPEIALPHDDTSSIEYDDQLGSPHSLMDHTTEVSESSKLLHGLLEEELVLPHLAGGGVDYNVLTQNADEPLDEHFVSTRILPTKSADFRHKLKQFFVFSTAGKPIYSLNGSDDAILSYMGLITTIVSTYQEKTNSEFLHVREKGLLLVVLNKSPLLLTAISKIPHECSPSAHILEKQLHVLYSYILAVLSRLVIEKHFHNRLNYDLRKLLSAQDMAAMDSLTLRLTYGFALHEEKHFFDPGFYLSTLLDSSLRCAAVRHSTRSKLASIFLSAKKIKQEKGLEPTGLDLLFGILAVEDKVLSYLRPSQHRLSNADLQTLLTTVASLSQPLPSEESTELWVPLCLPEFNDAGFMYCYVGKFELDSLDKPLTLILLSGNKNSFYEMKSVANYIIGKMRRSSSINKSLPSELSDPKLVLPLPDTPIIRHFLYRLKKYNQFYMEDGPGINHIQDTLHLTGFYAALHDSRATTVYLAKKHPKKLTYTRWQLKDEWVTAFLLSDAQYDFYCLLGGLVQAQDIIRESLSIIKCCLKYTKRISVGDGTVF